MIPFSVLFTKETQIYAQVEVRASSISSAIEEARKLLEQRKVHFKRRSVQFGNLESDSRLAKFFARRLSDSSYSVGISYPIIATAQVDLLAPDITTAQSQVPTLSATFSYKNVPLMDIQPDLHSYTISETFRPAAVLSVTPPYSAGAGTVADINIQLTNGNSGLAELYRDGVYQKTVELTGVGQVIQTDPLEAGNNVFQLRFLGTEDLSKSIRTFNIVATGFPSSVSSTTVLESSYYYGDIISLPVTVENASSYAPTGRVRIVSNQDIQSSSPLIEDATNLGESTALIRYLPPIGTYTPQLSYDGDSFLSNSSYDFDEIFVSKVPTSILDGYEFTPSIISSGTQFSIRGLIRCIAGQNAPQSGSVKAVIGSDEYDGYCTQGPDSESVAYTVYVGPLPSGTFDANILFSPYGDRWSSSTSTVSVSVGQGVESGDPPTFISATSVQTTGGQSTITGTKFALDVSVLINGVSGTVTYVSDTILKVDVPPISPGMYSIEITQSTGSTGIIPNGITVTTNVVLISATDSSVTGGNSTWTGTGFAADAVAYIDGVAMTTSYVSSTELTVTVPPGLTAGLHDGYVIQSTGTSNTVIGVINIIDTYNPATIAWTGWWEQRGDIYDYSVIDTDGGGPDIAKEWEGRSSAGTSGGRNAGDTQFGSGTYAPVLGTEVGTGRFAVDFSSGYRWLDAKLAASNFITSTAYTYAVVMQVPSNVASWNDSYFGSRAVMGIESDYGGIVCAQTSGVYYVGCYVYDGGTSTGAVGSPTPSVSGYKGIRAVVPADTWIVVFVKLEGGVLKMRVNDQPWQTVTCGSQLGMSTRFGFDSFGLGGDGKRLMSGRVTNFAMADSQIDDLYEYIVEDNQNLLLPEPGEIDPSMMDLSLWMDSRTYKSATYPAEPSWVSRGSIGQSGLYFWKRNDSSVPTATANPSTTTVNGNQVLSVASSSGYPRLSSSPATARTMADFLGTSSFFIQMVMEFNSVTNGPTDSPNTQSAPFSPTSGAGGIAIRATTGPKVTTSLFDNQTLFTYQYVSSNVTLNNLDIVQVEYNSTTSTLRIRTSSSPTWQSITTTGSNAMNQVFLMFASQLGGTDWSGKFAELITRKNTVGDSIADQLLNRSENMWL